MPADTTRQHSAFDADALSLAAAELEDALHALLAHDRAAAAARPKPAARAQIREKARTGRLKASRTLGAEAPRTPVAPAAEGTAPLVAPDVLEDLAAAVIDALPTGESS